MICFLVLLLCLQPSEEKSVKVLKIGFQVFEKAVNIFKTGLSIADFFNKKETDPGITEEDLARLKDDILHEVEQMLAIKHHSGTNLARRSGAFERYRKRSEKLSC